MNTRFDLKLLNKSREIAPHLLKHHSQEEGFEELCAFSLLHPSLTTAADGNGSGPGRKRTLLAGNPAQGI